MPEMFKMPSEFNTKTYAKLIQQRDDAPDRHAWDLNYFANYLYYQALYRWGQIPSTDYDKRTNRSNFIEYAMRVDPVDVGTMIRLFYDRDYVPFPFIIIITYSLSKGTNPIYAVSKIAIYRSDETCTELHGEPLVEAIFTKPGTTADYASVVIDWLDQLFDDPIENPS